MGYWVRTVSNALQNTLPHFRGQPKRKIAFNGLRTAAIYTIAFFIIRYKLGDIQMMEEGTIVVAFALAVVAVIIGMFLFNLLMAPLRMEEEKEANHQQVVDKLKGELLEEGKRLQILEEERIPKTSAEPLGGRRNQEWEHDHLMFAELCVTNTSPILALENVEIRIVSSLWILEHEKVFKLYDNGDWTPVSVYWSARDTGIADCLKSSISPNGSKMALIAFSDNSNGPPAVFNTPTHHRPLLIGGAKKIGIEVSCTTSALWKAEFYIECCPNYVNGPQATIEFVRWETWLANHKIV